MNTIRHLYIVADIALQERRYSIKDKSLSMIQGSYKCKQSASRQLGGLFGEMCHSINLG